MVVNPASGVAFFCNDSGQIIEIIIDELDIFESQIIAAPKIFQNIVDEPSRRKAFDFLLQIKSKKVAFDYQLNVKVRNEIKSLYFLGISLNSKILVIGANNYKEVVDFANRMQEINNEQANLIRKLVKKETRERQSVANQEIEKNDAQLYAEITKLNNELINARRELEKKNVELEKLNALKNKFLGMAAHDLRSPLNVIQSFSDFILEEAGDELQPDHKKFLGIIFNSTQFMLSMIEDLLDVSKIESGRVSLNLEKYNIVEQAARVIGLNQVLATKKKIRINLESGESNSIQVLADPNKTEQVFNNLITNAIKFSHEDSSIDITIKADKKFASISVRDYGLGIPEDKIEIIFHPFTKHQTRGTKGEKSTGLGLSIVKRIVEVQGGSISVSSKVNEGSVFTFTIPLTNE